MVNQKIARVRKGDRQAFRPARVAILPCPPAREPSQTGVRTGAEASGKLAQWVVLNLVAVQVSSHDRQWEGWGQEMGG